MDLNIKFLAGDETKQFLANLTAQIDRLDKLTNGGAKASTTSKTIKTKVAEPTDDFEEDSFETDDGGSAGTLNGNDSFEEDQTELAFDSMDAGEDDAPVAAKAAPKKASKVKIPTTDELNTACMDRVKRLIKAKKIEGDEARKLVVALLLKNFNTKSVSQIAPEDRANAIKILNGK